MSATRLLVAQLIVLLILTYIVFFGITHDFYWSIFWFSALAHFLGGLWAGIFGAWLLEFRGISRSFLFCIAVALLLGIFWEMFELVIGATHFPADTVDTVQDIYMDIIGGVAGALVARYVWVRE